MSDRSKAIRAARWVLILPAAFLAGLIGFLVPILMQDPAARSSFIDIIVGFGVSGLLFVGAGTYTAPSHRQTVAIVLGLLLVALTGIDFQGAMATSDAGAIVGLVVRVLGAVIAVIAVPQASPEAQRRCTEYATSSK